MINRGGLTLKPGKIGRANVLRQQLMMPCEQMYVRLSGDVKLETLRERDNLRINAQLCGFMQPVRWCDPNWVTYIKEGADTATVTTKRSVTDLSKFGIGTKYDSATNILDIYNQSLLNIHNQWLKWPEDSDISGEWPDDGSICVNLSKPWTRCRYSMTPDDSSDYLVSSGSNFDVRTLANVQAKFRSAQKLDSFSFGRWQAICQEMWGADGSREVDKVPVLFCQENVGVRPRDLPATDGASLGQWQSILDFQVDHTVNGLVAPEHMIITWILIVRFEPITESIHPLASQYMDWQELVADPEYLSAASPVDVQLRELFATASTTQLGQLAAGWQWRSDHDVIGGRIAAMDSFPMMEMPTTQLNAKDSTRVKPAFRSSRLGDYQADIYFTETCRQPIGTAMDSYLAGMTDQTKGKYQSNSEFPKGGKML